uniref:hypothetical protein n=1 Tax=Agathobacter sp. TaxID=2021311 RepID=UPI00405639B2
MLENVHDEVYFHTFLKARRTMMGVTLESVSKGIFSVSTIHRMEKDENVPEKLARSRILARLGVSGEKYEDYLPPKEYGRWLIRQKILKCIERKQLHQAEKLLGEYKAKAPKKEVDRQFMLAMKFMMLRIKAAPLLEQRTTLEKAIRETVQMEGEGFPEGLLLADQEINLFIEYAALYDTGNGKKDNIEWKLKEYQKIIKYIEDSYIDDTGRAKIYPKAVCYWMKLVYESSKENLLDMSLEIAEYGIAICNRAIELLRNMKKLFYFVELLELRHAFMESRLRYVPEGEKNEAEKNMTELNNWYHLLMDLYKEYKVNPYMEHFCHLYWEMQSYPMGDAIRARRNMLGMTKGTLSDDAYDLKSVTRCELNQVKTQKHTLRNMLSKVALGNDNVCTNVVTNDYGALELYIKMGKYADNSDFENWETCIAQLEKILCMDIPQNRQLIEREKNLLDYKRGNISNEEFIQNMKDVLGLTMSTDDIMNNPESYITKREMSCIYSIAMRNGENKENPYLDLLKCICEKYEQKDMITAYIIEYECIMTGIASLLGNYGKYEEGDNISKKIIKESLIHRRIGFIAPNLYHMQWNNQQKALKGIGFLDKRKELEGYKQCLILCEIPKLEVWISFLKDKINSIKEKHSES